MAVPRNEDYFAHKSNRDGTWNSICSRCFMTVATTHDESLLFEKEKAHRCAGFDLARMFYSQP